MPETTRDNRGTTGDHDLWIDVFPDRLATNVRALRRALESAEASAPMIMAVVKANGYGHGAVPAGEAFLRGGADWLGVTTFHEAKELVAAGLRPEPHAAGAGSTSRAGDDAPREAPAPRELLVFAPPATADQSAFAMANGLTMTVCDQGQIDLVAEAAAAADKDALVHLKVDTGMGRFGLPPTDALEVVRRIATTPRVKLGGVYTHFPQAPAADLEPTKRALSCFQDFCGRLVSDGIQPGIRHCANSAASLRLPQSRLDMVRLGTVLYGQYPSARVPRVDGLRADTWKMLGRVVFVRDLPPGASVGYGSEYRAPSPRRVAVIPVGFADGFSMTPESMYHGLRGLKMLCTLLVGKSRPHVVFNGHRAPVLGRVAMQTIVVDITEIPERIVPGSIAEIPIRRLAAQSSIPRIATPG
jgi:alanine racemase